MRFGHFDAFNSFYFEINSTVFFFSSLEIFSFGLIQWLKKSSHTHYFIYKFNKLRIWFPIKYACAVCTLHSTMSRSQTCAQWSYSFLFFHDLLGEQEKKSRQTQNIPQWRRNQKTTETDRENRMRNASHLFRSHFHCYSRRNLHFFLVFKIRKHKNCVRFAATFTLFIRLFLLYVCFLFISMYVLLYLYTYYGCHKHLRADVPQLFKITKNNQKRMNKWNETQNTKTKTTEIRCECKTYVPFQILCIQIRIRKWIYEKWTIFPSDWLRWW